MSHLNKAFRSSFLLLALGAVLTASAAALTFILHLRAVISREAAYD